MRFEILTAVLLNTQSCGLGRRRLMYRYKCFRLQCGLRNLEEASGTAELVPIYKFARRRIAYQYDIHQYHRENLRSRKMQIV